MPISKERKQANRETAAKSRRRRQEYVHSLESKVVELTAEKNRLEHENNRLRAECLLYDSNRELGKMLDDMVGADNAQSFFCPFHKDHNHVCASDAREQSGTEMKKPACAESTT